MDLQLGVPRNHVTKSRERGDVDVFSGWFVEDWSCKSKKLININVYLSGYLFCLGTREWEKEWCCSCNKSDIAQVKHSKVLKYEWKSNSEEWNHPLHFEIGLG